MKHDIPRVFYSDKDFSEVVYAMGYHEGTLRIGYEDISRKTKLLLNRFDATSGTLRFNEKYFFDPLFGFTSYWDYKPTNAIHVESPGAYNKEKI